MLLYLGSYVYSSDCVSNMKSVPSEPGTFQCGRGGLTFGEGDRFPSYVKQIILLNEAYDTWEIPRFKGTVKKGRLNGKAQMFYATRSVETEMNYVNDELNGKYTQFYMSGELKLETNFVKGKQNGKTTEYHKNGKVMKTSFYKNDKLEGKVKIYCEDGKLLLTQNFHNDELVGYVECANGKRGLENMLCECDE